MLHCGEFPYLEEELAYHLHEPVLILWNDELHVWVLKVRDWEKSFINLPNAITIFDMIKEHRDGVKPPIRELM